MVDADAIGCRGPDPAVGLGVDSPNLLRRYAVGLGEVAHLRCIGGLPEQPAHPFQCPLMAEPYGAVGANRHIEDARRDSERFPVVLPFPIGVAHQADVGGEPQRAIRRRGHSGDPARRHTGGFSEKPEIRPVPFIRATLLGLPLEAGRIGEKPRMAVAVEADAMDVPVRQPLLPAESQPALPRQAERPAERGATRHPHVSGRVLRHASDDPKRFPQ